MKLFLHIWQKVWMKIVVLLFPSDVLSSEYRHMHISPWQNTKETLIKLYISKNAYKLKTRDLNGELQLML